MVYTLQLIHQAENYDKYILLPDINIIDGEGNIKDDAAMFGDFVPKLDKNSQNKILWHLALSVSICALVQT